MNPNKSLTETLQINSPTFYSISDSVLNITRFNKVELNWSDITDVVETQDYLRDYFFSHSFAEVDETTKLSDCKGTFWDFISARVIVKETVLGPTVNGEPQEIEQSAEVVTELFCITLDRPRRLYVVGGKGRYFAKSDVEPFLEKSVVELWNEFDEKDCDYFLTYYDSGSNSLSFDKNPRRDLVSRELLFYKEKFEHLSAKLGFIQQVNNKIDGDFTSSILSDTETLKKLFGDSDLLSFYLSNYSRIKLIEIELRKEIDVIQNKLFEKGYFLETQKCDTGCNRTKWGRTFTSNFGEIYSLVQVEVIKEVEDEVDKVVFDDSFHPRPSGRGKDGRPIKIANGEEAWEYTGTRKKIVKEKVKRLVPTKEEQIKPVQIVNDPIYERILKLKEDGYWVHVFENRDGGYWSYDGSSSLSEIVDECEDSEETRIRTVVVVKDYESVDQTNRAVIRASFYFHPMRGILPSRRPAIGIRETLDQRMSWAGLELGKLIDSICLAPGETKTVSISNKFSSVASTTTSSKTFNEISTVSTNEFGTEFEKLVTNELEKTSESSSSISAGASYGGLVSASGDMRQSNKETIKDFTKDLNRSTSKATNTLSKRASLEVSFSTSTSVEQTSTSTSNSTVSNINQGRTLNLYYYQLNNRFVSRLYLENLRLEISSSFELIEGSGIYENIVMKLGQIRRLLSLAQQFVPHLKNGDDNKSLRLIIESVVRTLNEYTNTPLLIENEDDKLVASLNSLDIIRIENHLVERFNCPLSYTQLLDAYGLLISSIQFDNLYFNEDTFIVDSGSFYLDSQVGILPATEEYSETMRNLEASRIAAEVHQQESRNEEIRAKNRLLSRGQAFITNITSFRKKVVIDGANPQTNSFSLLSLSEAITEENWEIYVNGSPFEDCTATRNEDGKSILVNWGVAEHNADSLKANLVLINRDKILTYI